MRESMVFLLLVLLAGCGIEPHNTIGPDNPVHNGSKENIKKPAAVDDSMGAKSEVFCKVQNIFDNNCIKCHSANGQSPSLVRGSAPSVLINQKGHHGQQIVKPGSSSDSELFKLISSTDPNHRMPKGAPPLAKEDIELIKTWIDAGASFTCSQRSS